MSLQALVEAIQDEATAAASEIGVDADRQVAQIEAVAKQEAAQARAEARDAALRPLEAERRPLLLQAQMDATRGWEAARALLVETALAATTKEMQRLRRREDYPALMWRLLAEAVEALDVAGALCVEVDSRDEALAREMVADAGLVGDRPVTVLTRLHTGGGLCVATPDGALRVDNTMETRMERVLPRLRARLGLFFAAGQEGDD